MAGRSGLEESLGEGKRDTGRLPADREGRLETQETGNTIDGIG